MSASALSMKPHSMQPQPMKPRSTTPARLRALHVLVALAALAASLTVAFHSAPATAAAGTNALYPNESLTVGQHLYSTNRAFDLYMQGDSNLVIYYNGRAIWATNTVGSGSNPRLLMQTDGNLVLYTSAGARWSSVTWGTSPGLLLMQDDGNLVVYNSAGRPTWASNTVTPPPAYNTDAGINELVNLFNNYRSAHGLVPEIFVWDLTQYARDCALGMARTNAPLAHCRSNEIIEYNTNPSPQAWFQAWLDSPPHKALIEWPNNRWVGAGAAYNPASGRYYIVMDFA